MSKISKHIQERLYQSECRASAHHRDAQYWLKLFEKSERSRAGYKGVATRRGKKIKALNIKLQDARDDASDFRAKWLEARKDIKRLKEG